MWQYVPALLTSPHQAIHKFRPYENEVQLHLIRCYIRSVVLDGYCCTIYCNLSSVLITQVAYRFRYTLRNGHELTSSLAWSWLQNVVIHLPRMSSLTSDINVCIWQIITFEHPTATVLSRVFRFKGLKPFFFSLSHKFGFIYRATFYSQRYCYNIAVNSYTGCWFRRCLTLWQCNNVCFVLSLNHIMPLLLGPVSWRCLALSLACN
jgi:hypothetical protein